MRIAATTTWPIFADIFLGSTPRKIVLPPAPGNARALHNFVCTRGCGLRIPAISREIEGVCRPSPAPAAAVSARPRCSPLSARSVRSLSPFGERAGVRGLQDYREIRAPHPTPLPAEVGYIRLRPLMSAELGQARVRVGRGSRPGPRRWGYHHTSISNPPSAHPAL